MCAISGFYNHSVNYKECSGFYLTILERMQKAQRHRGPDGNGCFLDRHSGLSHSRLAIIDLKTGAQPMIFKHGEYKTAIVYNGELYNMPELKKELLSKGYVFHTASDTEVILNGYMEYGSDIVNKLNGIFAFAIWDEKRDCLLLFRDRLGIKPLFYHRTPKQDYVFASELKALFAHPSIHPRLDCNGLNEVFSLGPAKTPGCGVFKDIHEVLPGTFLEISGDSIRETVYWKLTASPHTDSYEETLEKTRELVLDAITRQMISDVPIATFLSGGVDSSIVSAVCALELKKKGKTLDTFSFDFKENDKYFQPNSFQPSQDRPFVDIMADAIGSHHRYLECTNEQQAALLYDSVLAHDLPCMADVDSSMLYFCSLVREQNKVVLTGECADEIFGGYPWFHKSELLSCRTFPWTPDLSMRKALLRDDFLEALHMESYIENAYSHSVAEVPTLIGEPEIEKKRREVSYLNIRWFMQTLLDRMDRASMYCGLEARVPFADHRIVSYLFNVPWEMKAKDGIVKGLLRNAMKGILPDEILFRRKSPYPKTYDPHYEQLLAGKLREVMQSPSSPILQFIDPEKTNAFLSDRKSVV